MVKTLSRQQAKIIFARCVMLLPVCVVGLVKVIGVSLIRFPGSITDRYLMLARRQTFFFGSIKRRCCGPFEIKIQMQNFLLSNA